MMVMRKTTGWEHLRDNPIAFFEDVLLISPTVEQRMILREIAAGTRRRLGLLWGVSEHVDEASLLVGIMLWRSAACHRPTLLWGGRRVMAHSWISHAAALIGAARSDFRNMLQVRIEKDRPWGIALSNGTWAVRYEDPFSDSAQVAANAMGGGVDVLIGDFEWTDRETVSDAVKFGQREGALVSMVVAPDARRL